MDEVIRYIISFLLGEGCDASYCEMVGYTSVPEEFGKYRVVIRPSNFFDEGVYGKKESMPLFPLKEVDGVPLLYGNPEYHIYGKILVADADIIAGAFFLLSRYEEMVNRESRDVHGRFPGHESLLFRAGCIDRPIVDEYGLILRKWLERTGVVFPENQSKIGKVWLTHDIDAPFFCRSFRNVLRETFKGCGFLRAMSYYRGNLENDPYYTFPWILIQDKKLKVKLGDRCDSLFFVKSGGTDIHDRPFYDLTSEDVCCMANLLKENGALIGLHSSYESGRKTELVSLEKGILEKKFGIDVVRFNRNHFLRSCEPENFTALIEYGITDDFSMGYADVSGFRLGTSRPVRWIDPLNICLTNLILHPLLVMDCTLNESKYMGLSMDDAFDYCVALFEKVKVFGGEIVLLWHNTSFGLKIDEAFDHRSLYNSLIEYICETFD